MKFGKGFHIQFPGFILGHFKILESQVLQQKTICAFLVNWFQFNWTFVVAFMTMINKFDTLLFI